MKNYFLSNVDILFSDLRTATNSYCMKGGDEPADFAKINAYLSATMNAIVEYQERFYHLFLSETISACKGANNSLKHDTTLITPIKIQGGLTFPMEFPACINPIEIIWKSDLIKCRHQDQVHAFKDIFAGKEILQTLEPIVKIILNSENQI